MRLAQAVLPAQADLALGVFLSCGAVSPPFVLCVVRRASCVVCLMARARGGGLLVYIRSGLGMPWFWRRGGSCPSGVEVLVRADLQGEPGASGLLQGHGCGLPRAMSRLPHGEAMDEGCSRGYVPRSVWPGPIAEVSGAKRWDCPWRRLASVP